MRLGSVASYLRTFSDSRCRRRRFCCHFGRWSAQVIVPPGVEFDVTGTLNVGKQLRLSAASMWVRCLLLLSDPRLRSALTAKTVPPRFAPVVLQVHGSLFTCSGT